MVHSLTNTAPHILPHMPSCTHTSTFSNAITYALALAVTWCHTYYLAKPHPPQSHTGSHTVMWGYTCCLRQSRSCHTQFHVYHLQWHVISHNHEVLHMLPQLPMATHCSHTLSSKTLTSCLLSLFIQSHTELCLCFQDFGGFILQKALKVQAKGWLGPRGLGGTDCWLHRRGTPPSCPEAMLCPQELSGATTVVVVVGGTGPVGKELAGDPKRGPGKGMRWLTGPDSTTGPRP